MHQKNRFITDRNDIIMKYSLIHDFWVLLCEDNVFGIQLMSTDNGFRGFACLTGWIAFGGGCRMLICLIINKQMNAGRSIPLTQTTMIRRTLITRHLGCWKGRMMIKIGFIC